MDKKKFLTKAECATYAKICEALYEKTNIESLHNCSLSFTKMARENKRPTGSKKYVRTPEQAHKDIFGIE